ncbi:PAS domain S-box protein [Natrinema salsiterrestre]|uniref:histidine kinase n=1 Tax=Natrinema salsiterrestre TaxID=2950540 RepID=A0A9Q4L4P0_9EURY|nr:PAS domain S-box protein [Natrinema salsiterrestre]MDF9747259.1 PAS domain S-box protein [Natrinema salsiterrestre]
MIVTAVSARILAAGSRRPLGGILGVIGIAIGVGAGLALSEPATLGIGSVPGPGVFVLGLAARSGSDRQSDIERLTDQLRQFVARIEGERTAAFTEETGDGPVDADRPIDFTIDRDDDIGRLSAAVDDLAGAVRDRERRRAESERYRQDLYRITSDPSCRGETKVRRLLELGCERLGVETGLIARIDESSDRYEIETAVGREGDREGMVLDLSTTYCQETIESDDILGIYDAAATGRADHPIADRLDISCYVGGEITVEDDLYGTLCFLNAEPRDRPFTPAEKSFIDLMTRWLSHAFERRRYVRRIREREERLERAREFTDDMLDAVDDVVYLLDEDGELQRWNESLTEVTGYADDEIAAMHALDFFDESNCETVANAIEEALETGRTRVESMIETKSGETIPYEFSASALEDPAGNRVIAGIGRDVSERATKERRLERAREFTDDMLDAVDDVFYLLDEDGDLRRWNESLGEVTGYADDEIAEMHALDFFDETNRRIIRDSIAEAFETGETHVEAALETKSGERVPYEFVASVLEDPDGTPVEAGIGRDISDRKERERTLERTRRLLSQAQRLANVGGWELDATADPPELEWSDEVYRIHDVPIDDPIDVDRGIEFYHPDDRPSIEAAIEGALEDGESYDHELRLITADGDHRWIRSIGEPVYEDGEVVKIQGSVQDITERKERERELERTTELLEQAQRIAGFAGWELDVRPDENELAVTDGLYQLFDVPPGMDVGPADSLEFYHPEDRPEVREAIRAAITTGESYDLEVRLFSGNGSERWVRVIGEPVTEGDEVVAIRGSIQDITERKERERELERFETIVQALDELVYTLDEEGRFTFLNDAATPILGYEPEELIGEPAATVIPAADVENAQEMIRELLRSDDPSRTVEIALETADGDLIDVENHIALLPMGDGEFAGTAGVVRDITERKERERRLETTSARLEALFENSPDMINVLDTEGTIVDANRRLADELGYAERELVGTNIWEHDSAFDSDHVVTFLEDLSIGERRKFESEYQRRDGSTFPVEVHLICIDIDNENRFMAISRDVSERKTRERDLRETKRRLELALEGTNTGVWEWDLDTDAVSWNETLERIVGLEPGSFGGTFDAFKDYVHPDDLPRIETAVERAIANDELFQTEFRLRHEDGTWIWVGARARVVKTEDGGTRMVGINNDITPRKEHELALESLHAAARDLLGTDSEAEVAELVVETAAEILDASGVAVYHLDSEVNRLEPVAYTDEFATLCAGPPPVAVGDPDSVLWNAYVTEAGTVVDDPASFDRSQVFGPDVERGVVVPVGDHGVFAVASSGEPIDTGARQLIETLVATTEAAFDRLESEASLREREAELEDRNRRLNRQISITELIRRIDQSLIGADGREEIERTVTDRLLEADDVAFGWIGALDAGGTRLEPRAWAGPGQEYLDDVPLEYDGATEPSVRTARSETPTVVSNVVDGLQDEEWRREALNRGYQSVISVPVSYAEYTYGVLTVYADEPDAFGDLERTVLTELGEGIANAITAAKTREALHAETLLELTLEIEGSDDPLSRIETTTGAAVEYEGLGAHSTDETVLFFETSGVPADEVRAALDDLVSVTAYRLISETDDECRFEATVTGDIVASRLVRHGGSPRSMTAAGDGMEVTVDVPTGTDVREFVEMLRDQYATVDLQARRHVERSMGSRGELVTSLFDGLTDRQLEVLRTAYFAGFFEWPRESTGEEIADMLDVTQPTVNRHLRVGQQRLLAQLFEDEVPLPAA